MKQYLLTIALLLSSSASIYATSIRGKVLAPAGTTLYLYDYRLHVSDTVGEVKSGLDSLFLMPLPENAYHGFYRLVWEGGFVDVLYAGEAISFEQTHANEFNILRGSHWQTYRQTKERLRRLRDNQSRLTQLIEAYEGESRALIIASKQIKKLAKAEAKLVKSIQTNNNFAYRHLRFELPFLAANPTNMAATYTREQYLDLLDLSDTVQLHFNLVPQMLVAYYRLFEPTENEDEEVLAISFINRVFDKLELHPMYFYGVADFLRIGFQQMNQPRALQLIAQKVATQNACTNPQQHERLLPMLQQYERMAPGAAAPALTDLVKADGSTVNTQAVAPGILVFWTADCPHCLRDLPPLHLWLKNNHPQLGVTAVALDAWETGWKAELLQLEGWQHLRDPKGWGGATSENYLLSATPFFVRIDSNGKIIDTYRSEAALRKSLE